MDEEAQDDISRNRGPTFSKIEVKALINLIENHKSIILNKSTNSKVNHAKEVAWANIAKVFNNQGFEHERTPEKLKMKWENMKREARKLSKNLIDIDYNEYSYLTSKVVGMINENEKCVNNVEIPDVDQDINDTSVGEKDSNTKYWDEDDKMLDQSVDGEGENVKLCRSLNFSPQECGLLLKCVRDEKKYIFSKEINGRAIKLKNNAWSRITYSFNKLSPEKRSTKVLRTKFNNMKKFAKNIKIGNYVKINNDHKKLVEEDGKEIKSEPMYECDGDVESDSISDIEVDNSVDVTENQCDMPLKPDVGIPDPLSTVLNSDSGIDSLSNFEVSNAQQDKEIAKLKLELLKYQLETAKLERQRLQEALQAEAAEREAKAIVSSLRIRAARLEVAAAEMKLPADHPALHHLSREVKGQMYSQRTSQT